MVDEAAMALAGAAGKALVAAMASDAWTSFKRAFARLLAHGEPSQSVAAEEELERQQSKLSAAPVAWRERLAAELESVCQMRFADLLRAEPNSADEVRALVDHVSAAVPTLTWAPVNQEVRGSDQARQAVLGQGTQNNSFGSGTPQSTEHSPSAPRVESIPAAAQIASTAQNVSGTDHTWQAVAGPGGTQVNYWGINPLSPEAALSIAAPLGRRNEALPLRGRAGLLDELAEASRVANASQVHVLHGLGGCGKTSIALEAAQLVANGGAEVWWLSATDDGRLLAGMHALARRLGMAENLLRYGEVADLVWERLSTRKQPWLLVVDNADDPTVLTLGGQPLRDGTGWIRPVESTSGLILITSRDGRPASWGPWCKLHRVAMLSASAAADVLRDHAREAGSRSEAEQLGDRLGRLPLALRLAGSYLAEACTVPAAFASDVIRTYTGYLQAIEDGRLDTLLVIPETGPLTEEQTRSLIGPTWELSLNLLERRGSMPARQMLNLLACFADAPIPYELLLHPGTLAGTTSFSGITGPLVWQNLKALSDFGLIDLEDWQRDTRGIRTVQLLQVHPLIRDISRRDVDAREQYDTYMSLAVISANQAVINDAGVPEDPRRWPLWQTLTPHVAHLLTDLSTRFDATYTVLEKAADAASRCARYLSAKGFHQRAGDLYRTVCRVYERTLPADHASTLGIRHDIAWEAAQQGDYDRAEAMYQQVLDTDIRVLGADNPSTLAARHEIARIKARQGNNAQAEALLQEILQDEIRLFFPDHPSTLVTRHEIARIATERGDFARAESLYRAVVEAKTRILGADHPSTLASRHSVAWVVTQRGDFADAESLYHAAVEAKTRTLGADHPSTLASRHDIAWITAGQGNYKHAEALFNEILEAKIRTLGVDHPSTLVTRHSMAWAIAQQRGNYSLAEELYREVLRAKAQVFGTDRPDRIAAQV